jgi:hypothetical protein
MTGEKRDVIKCSRCKNRWEIVRGEVALKLCEGCRERNRENYRNRSAESTERFYATARLKYNTDEERRLKILAVVSARLKSSVVCSECDKTMNYGSLLPHRKCCKGRNSKTTAQRILELSASFPDS